jgi:hypothetical protein
VIQEEKLRPISLLTRPLVKMESLQQIILDILERGGKIEDTRNIQLPASLHKDDVQEAQMVIQGALNSLLSREVSQHDDLQFVSG